jgi:hypothetical protein
LQKFLVLTLNIIKMENQEINPIPATPVTPPAPGTPSTQIVFPGSIMWMIFGIVSVILCWYGFIPYAGPFLAIVALVFGVLAMKKGKKMQAEYDANPDMYKKASKAFIKVASITGLIGLIVAAIFFVIGIVVTILAVMEGAMYYY